MCVSVSVCVLSPLSAVLLCVCFLFVFKNVFLLNLCVCVRVCVCVCVYVCVCESVRFFSVFGCLIMCLLFVCV